MKKLCGINTLNGNFCFYAGCSLKGDKKEHRVEVDDDEAEHQLSLKSVRKISPIQH